MKRLEINNKEIGPIIVVARQAGSAQAFLPILSFFDKHGIAYCFLVFRSIESVVHDSLVQYRLIDTFVDAKPIMESIAQPSLVLTGTSEKSCEDHLFWQWAKQKKVASIAFVDSWINYTQRFSDGTDPAKHFDLIPDHIAVIDELMRDGLVAAGCKREKILIAGNPAFDRLSKLELLWQELEQEESFRPYVDREYFVFVDEPFNVALGPDEKEYYGFTQQEVLTSLLMVLDRIGKQQGKKQLLIIKPHPRRSSGFGVSECVGDASKFDHVELVVSRVSGPFLSSKAQVVFGMTSVLLLEASMMGVAVISLQPGRKRTNAVTDHRPGIRVIIEKDQLEGQIQQVGQRRPPVEGIDHLEQFISMLLSVKQASNSGLNIS